MLVWAAVLVPMWLRRHDAVTESRSVDRFSTAMRVLSRRPPRGGGSRYVVPPVAPPDGSQRRFPGLRRLQVLRTTPGRSRPRDARAQLREARARLLVVLVGLAGVSFLLALAGVTAWWPHLLVDLLLAGYVVHLRVQVIKAAPIAVRLPATLRDPEPAYADADESAATPVTAVPAPAAAAGAGAGWAPNPVPLPTYVTAPVASRSSRERPLSGSTTEPFQPDDAEIEVLFERRWAVND